MHTRHTHLYLYSKDTVRDNTVHIHREAHLYLFHRCLSSLPSRTRTIMVRVRLGSDESRWSRWYSWLQDKHQRVASSCPSCLHDPIFDFSCVSSPHCYFWCYQWCRESYRGLGTVCWQIYQFVFWNGGAFWYKPAYERGVGTVVRFHCLSDEELNGLLCSKTYWVGYCNVHPVCWARCRCGYKDHGATRYRSFFHWYFKNAYGGDFGRAAGNRYDSGKPNVGELCYPVCRTGTRLVDIVQKTVSGWDERCCY